MTSLSSDNDQVFDTRATYREGAIFPDIVPPEGDILHAWLQLANLQFSSRLTTSLLARFAFDPVSIFRAKDADLEETPGLQSKHLVRLRDPNLEATERQVAWIEKHGVRLILRGQSEYPLMLLDIPDPPPLLFVRGKLLDEDRTSVGIVGSRHATPYGKATSERLARELAGHGVTVVSGGAVGIDAAAHRGALDGGGRTIAVLGCGLDVDYPRENRALFERVIESGAMLSEYPLGAQPESWRFPQRNRLISGLSLGTLVVEAPRQSGALITSRLAAEHGRPVLVVPGNIDRPTSQGSNDLLKDGAFPVTETDDILRALDLVVLPARPDHQSSFDMAWAGEPNEDQPSVSDASTPGPSTAMQPSARSISSRTLPENQQKLLELLSLTPRHLDALASTLDLSASQAGVEMTLLELAGFVRRLPGNTYIRTS